MECLSCLYKIKRTKFILAIMIKSTELIIFFKKKTALPLVLPSCDRVQEFVRKVQNTFKFIFSVRFFFFLILHNTLDLIPLLPTLAKNYARATTSVKANFLQERVSAKLLMNDANITAVFPYT